MPEIRVGQVWADNDPRAAGRLIEITEVHDADDHRSEPYVRVRVRKVSRNVARKEAGEQRTILQRRFRPTRNGYRLVEDAAPAPAGEAYPEGQQKTGDAWNWGGVDMHPSSHPFDLAPGRGTTGSGSEQHLKRSDGQ